MSALAQNRIAPVVITGRSTSAEDILKRQRAAIAKGRFMVAGRIMAIKFDRDGDAREFAPGTPDISKLTLEWNRKTYPVLAFNSELGMLLPLGLPALPDIPDPSWKPPTIASPHGNGDLIADPDARAPMISQSYSEHASGRFEVGWMKKITYLVFQPILQIAYIAAAPADKKSSFKIVTGLRNDQDDRYPMLLYNPASQHAYFLGGRWQNG